MRHRRNLSHRLACLCLLDLGSLRSLHGLLGPLSRMLLLLLLLLLLELLLLQLVKLLLLQLLLLLRRQVLVLWMLRVLCQLCMLRQRRGEVAVLGVLLLELLLLVMLLQLLLVLLVLLQLLLQLLMLLMLMHLVLLHNLVLLLLLELHGALLVVDAPRLEDKAEIGLAALRDLHPLLRLERLVQLGLLQASHRDGCWGAASRHLRLQTGHRVRRDLQRHSRPRLLARHGYTMRSTRHVRPGRHCHRVSVCHLGNNLRRQPSRGCGCGHSLTLRTSHDLLLLALDKNQ